MNLSSSTFQLPSGGWKGIRKYVSDATNAPENSISQPSKNCVININGDVETRGGYIDTAWTTGAGAQVRPFYLSAYDITVLIGDSKVQYVDHNNSNTVVDTGSTVTADTITRGDEYLGDLYYTNTTNGVKRGVFGKLNDATADIGDATVFVDVDMAARLSVFGKTAGAIIINGDSYAYNAVNVSTGQITLNGVTLTAGYADNTVVFVEHDISSGIEKFSKLIFWKERLMGMGFPSASNADQPNHSVMVSKFVIGQAGASGIEDIIDFTYGTGGATKIVVGKGGKMTSIVGIKDFIYFLKEDSVSNTASSAISVSGASIGLTIPEIKDENHGCLNEDSAISIGNNEIAYITNDKRILRVKLFSDGGAAVPFPDELFDVDIWKDLENMDDDQPLGMAVYHKAQRVSIFQVRLGGQWYWLMFDHKTDAWQPPQLVIPANGFFERKGILYATDSTTDQIYEVFTTFDDNGIPIECTVATPIFDVDDSMMTTGEAKGIITHSTNIEITTHTWTNAGEKVSSPKMITGSNYTYGEDRSIGSVAIGGINNATRLPYADWKRSFDIYPQEANKIQLQLFCEGDHFSLSRFSLVGQNYSRSFTSSL